MNAESTHTVLFLLLNFFVALTTSMSAAQVGGEATTLYSFEGALVNEEWGASLALAGDVDADGVDDFIIGAPGASPSGLSRAGSAFVYSGATGAELYRFDGRAASDYLGIAVSAAGDVNADGFDDVMVGAPYADTQLYTSEGYANVYSGADGSVLYQYESLSLGSNMEIGASLAPMGDLDLDGFDDFAIGAPGYNYVGTVYVYSGVTGSLIYQLNPGYFTHSFATSMAPLGDIDGDGFFDLLVGDPFATYEDQASVFSGATGALLYEMFESSPYSSFSYSVSSAGDLDGDGVDDFLVGEPFADPQGVTDAGSVMLYSGFSGSLILQFDGREAYSNFGVSVSGGNDVDGDGIPDILIGAPSVDFSGFTRSGTALLFSGATLELISRIHGAASSDQFGWNLEMGSDFDGDGEAEFMAAAPYANPNGVLGGGYSGVYSFASFLSSDTYSISNSSGGILNLDLNFPDSAAFMDFQVLFSKTGRGPVLLGIDVPLTPDALTRQAVLGRTPFAGPAGLSGTLDQYGNALTQIPFQAGAWSSLTGMTLRLAAVAHLPGQLPEYSSISIPFEVLP